MKLGGIEGPFVQQVSVGGAAVKIDSAGGDEFVEKLEALVVTRVEHQTAVCVDYALGALVLEASKGGALDRGGRRVQRAYLDDPAEAVGFKGLGIDVEPIVEPSARSAPRSV